MEETDLRSAWNSFCDRLKDGADVVLDPGRPGDDIDRAEGIRALLRRLASDISRDLEGGDPEHPELSWFHPFKNGQDNPDGLYQIATVDLSRTYRLSGNIGTVRYLGLSVMTTDFSEGKIEQFLTVNGDDLQTDENGAFELLFGAGPCPDDMSSAVWHALPPRRCRLMVRQFFYDWEVEEPADLHLECLEPGPAPSRLGPIHLTSRLGPTADRVVDMTAFWADFGSQHLARGEVNSFDHVQSAQGAASSMGGSLDQGYGQAWYRIAEGEALLLEVEIPECTYWAVQLGDVWYQSLDWWNRQSSLNGHQAVVGTDGVFRAVIAHRDPGIANWLDTTGATQGVITFRWNQATFQPVPTAELVSFDDLTVRLDDRWSKVTPIERAEVLRLRRRAALRRFRR
ncbi:MAG: hypothetical protein CL468_01695 [Acidimicrobiaceae bacterium]|nr:hypothetical protein [Acidimicrobiaceae bacterium]